MSQSEPLLLTLQFAAASFMMLDEWRRRYFPPDRNLVPAHLTFFHQLPGAAEQAILAQTRLACGSVASVRVIASGVRFLGSGFALAIEAGPLAGLRQQLVREWGAWLTPQDQQPWRPHVTLQNKVSPNRARQDFDAFRASFIPFTLHADGLLVWRYQGGPWAPVAAVSFGAESASS